MPQPAGRVARHRVGRGDKGVGSVVDIKMDALSAFKKDVAVFSLRFLQAFFHLGEVGHQARGEGQQVFAHGVFIKGVKFVEVAQQNILFLQGVRNLGAHEVGIGQIACAQAHARGLVFVAGADAASCGAYLVPGAFGFARPDPGFCGRA